MLVRRFVLWKYALELLREMRPDRLSPNTITFRATIAREKSMQWQAASEVEREVRQVAQDTMTSKAAISV